MPRAFRAIALLCTVYLLNGSTCVFILLLGSLKVDKSHAESSEMAKNVSVAAATNNNTAMARERDKRDDLASLKSNLNAIEKALDLAEKIGMQQDPAIAVFRQELASIKRLMKQNEGALNRTLSFKQWKQIHDLIDSFTAFTNKSAQQLKAEEYCKTEGSLNEVVFKMANHSSPPGSASYNKTKRILEVANSFYIDLGVPIFDNVATNIASMLKGMGLRQEPAPTDRVDVIRIERTQLGAARCNASPRIIIQTEQLFALGKWYLTLFRDCHYSDNCIIWDFSDYNHEYAKLNGFAESVVLLPIMIQSRLTQGQEEEFPMKSLVNRTLDVVFFAYMLERRKLLKQEILNHQKWNMIFEDNNQTQVMVESYQNAKVCLVAHSYHSQSGGEYHRLSEMATLGCVPVMEEFADTIAIDDYARCGGVVFARYENLIDTVAAVLSEIDTCQRDTITEYVEWWKRGIQWENVLVRMFGESDQIEG